MKFFLKIEYNFRGRTATADNRAYQASYLFGTSLKFFSGYFRYAGTFRTSFNNQRQKYREV